MKLASTKQLAVGIMLGLVTESAIIGEASGGPTNAPYPIRRLTIAPFAQEMRRDTSLWVLLFGFRVITGTVSNNGISFNSRKKADVTDGTSSPSKPNSFLMTVSNPLISSPSKGRTAPYPFSRAFEDRSTLAGFLQPCFTEITSIVPIYDGRIKSGTGVSFTDDGFASLANLPLYRNGIKDLQHNAVVAVGYTLGTWTRRSGDVNLSTNLQFIIMLGAIAAKPV
jgi:hypothetical protein